MLALKSLVSFNNCFRPSHTVTSSLPNKAHYAIATYRIITFYVNIHHWGRKRARDYHKHSLYGVFFSTLSNFIRNSKYKLQKTSKIHSSILNQLKNKIPTEGQVLRVPYQSSTGHITNHSTAHTAPAGQLSNRRNTKLPLLNEDNLMMMIVTLLKLYKFARLLKYSMLTYFIFAFNHYAISW